MSIARADAAPRGSGPRASAHCAGPDACAWAGLCAPGRCIAAEAEGSPNYAVFAPTESDSCPRHRDGRAAGGCNRVVPSGTDDRGASLALACGFCAGLLAMMALAAARWWGWI